MWRRRQIDINYPPRTNEKKQKSVFKSPNAPFHETHTLSPPPNIMIERSRAPVILCSNEVQQVHGKTKSITAHGNGHRAYVYAL